MLTAHIRRYGGPEVVKIGVLPAPTPGPGEVVFRMEAASVNPVDFKIHNGLLRALQSYRMPAILGNDAAGVVTALGPGVTGFALGDRIAVFNQGHVEQLGVPPDEHTFVYKQGAEFLCERTGRRRQFVFTETLPGRARCFTCHPINPPYLVPAVELVPAPWTTAETMARAEKVIRGIGQAPIVMRRELDGFVMNRMQGALLEEAFRLVADGYCTVEDVDTGIRDGLALRWAFMGPFETIDLNAPGGVRDYCARYQQIYARLFPSMQRRVDWSGEVAATVETQRRERLPAHKLAERQRWRDRRLMALLRHKRDAASELGS